MSEVRVALTFDAEHPSRRQCPPGNAERILETLRTHDVSASFFIQGRWATAYPAIARAIANGGHLIGSHSHSHAPMPDLSDAGLLTDIDEAEASIRAVTAVDPRPWFRCPFGAGWDDPRVLAALHRRGYRNIHWEVDAADWEDVQTPAVVSAEIVRQSLAHGDGAIVLLHTWPAPTAEALSEIIERLRGGNARFVTLAELGDAG